MERLTRAKLVWLLTLLAVPTAIHITSLQVLAVEDGSSLHSSENESEKVTVGVVEDIILSPWGISIPARIDTGADLSSLDARDIVVRNDVAEFKLGKRYGSRQLQLPVVDWRRIQTAMGIEKRPVVEISMCLGSKLFRTLATLKDRSEMLYPFLVGRSALDGKFIVDPSRSKTAQPACPSLSSGGKQLVTASND